MTIPYLFKRSGGLLCSLFMVGWLPAQQVYTLDACLNASDKYQPLAKQQPLIEAAHRAAVAQLRSNYFPQASLNGQASWQSEVTAIPIKLPNVEIPSLSKDQYRFTLDLVQPLWDGGQIAAQTKIQTAQTQIEQQKVLVDRYTAREQTMQLYCAALMAQKQVLTLQSTQNDLRARRNRTQEQVKNGTAIPAHVLSFDARLLEMEQMQEEALSRKSSAMDGLSLLTGLSFQPIDSLVTPQRVSIISLVNERPELTLFGLQQASTRMMEKAVDSKLTPRFNAVATFGYSRPGLNFLANEFQPYTILGVNFKWNLSGFYNGAPSKERQQYRLQSERTNLQKEQFLLQSSLKQAQQQREMERYAKVLERDKAIVSLRDQIAATAAVQLENGVLTPSEYLIEATNATTARLNAAIHEIQWVEAQLLLAFINGNM